MTESIAAPQRLAGTFQEFRDDLAAAVGVWRRVPWLVVVGVLLSPGVPTLGAPNPASSPAPAGAVPGAVVPLVAAGFVLMLVLGLLSLGWSGAERLAYAWQWAGIETSFRTIVSAAWGYVGRFLVLGLLLFLPFVGLAAAISAAGGMLAGMLATSLCLNVLLTFVTPALAYDEDRTTIGLRVGVALLARQGKRAVWYALVGPAVLLGITALGQFLPFGEAVVWLIGGVAVVALRGATAAAYLRLTRSQGVHAPPPAGP